MDFRVVAALRGYQVEVELLHGWDEERKEQKMDKSGVDCF